MATFFKIKFIVIISGAMKIQLGSSLPTGLCFQSSCVPTVELADSVSSSLPTSF